MIVLRLAGISLLIVLLYFLLAPSGIDPEPWQPPSDLGMTGAWTPNTRLHQSRLLAQGQVNGPEGIDQDAQGRVYAGLANGDIVRLPPDGSPEVLVNTGGRPLGLAFDAQGRLLIADARQGLLRLTLPNQLEVLLHQVDERRLGLADDLDIAHDGTVYLTDASWRWPISHYRNDALEARPHGRLIRFDPGTGQATVLLDNLYFPNGVALSTAEDFVLVNETWRYRILRHWLHGPNAGVTEIFVDNLPGFPDGVSNNGQGMFWVTLMAPRVALLDAIHPHPWLKRLSVKLPPFLQPQAQRQGLVAGYDEFGQLLYTLQDPDGQWLWDITSVRQTGDSLLLGSLTADRIGYWSLGTLKPD